MMRGVVFVASKFTGLTVNSRKEKVVLRNHICLSILCSYLEQMFGVVLGELYVPFFYIFFI